MKNGKLKTLSVVLSFLLLEIVAFVAFGLSNSFIVFGIIGLVVLALALVVTFKQLKEDGFTDIFVFLIPILLFGLVNALSPFSTGSGMSAFHLIILATGGVAFAFVGYLSNYLENFKISHIIMGIYGGLALITIISYIFTMIQFVPFYTLIHNGHYIYYDGVKSDYSIGQTAYFLMGLKMQEVSVNYFSLFPSVLSSAVIALFFVPFKTEKKKFFIYLAFALIGIIPLLTMPTKITLITDFLLVIAIAVIILFAKNKIKNKIFSYIMMGFAGVAALAFILFIFNAQDNLSWTAGLRNAIANNALLNRVFNNNSLVEKYKAILVYIFEPGALLGFYPYEEYRPNPVVLSSSSALFDTFLTSGVFGFILFITMIVIGYMNLVKYFQKSKDDILTKSLITGIITTTLLYSLINYDSEPYCYYYDFQPIYMVGIYFIVLFLFGYVTFSKEKKEVEVEVTPNESEETTSYEI